MDERNCRSSSDTQLVEKDKTLDEIIVQPLRSVKDLLDRPLNHFTEKDIIKITERLNNTLKATYYLPPDTLIQRSYNILRQGLRHTILELTLALDQFSVYENKASFYEHLLLSQEALTELLAINYSRTHEEAHPDRDPQVSPSIGLPARNVSLLYYSKKILPDIYTILQQSQSISTQQYEHVLESMQTLDELLKKQKKICETSSLIDIDNNVYDVLCKRLTVSLSYGCELLQQLIVFILALQDKVHLQSKRAEQFREEMLYVLTLFIRNFDNILQQTQKLTTMRQQEHFQQTGTDRFTQKVISIRR